MRVIYIHVYIPTDQRVERQRTSSSSLTVHTKRRYASLSLSLYLSLLSSSIGVAHHTTVRNTQSQNLYCKTRVYVHVHTILVYSPSLSLSLCCPLRLSRELLQHDLLSVSLLLLRTSLSLSVSLPLVYNDTHSTAITQSRRIYTHSHPNTSTCLSRTRRLRTNTSRITHALFCYDTTPKSQKRISIRISIDQSIKRDICRRRVDHGDSRVVVVVVVVVTRSVVLVLCIITEILICV